MRWFMLGTTLFKKWPSWEKSHQHNDFATEILNYHPNKVSNIIVAWFFQLWIFKLNLLW